MKKVDLGMLSRQTFGLVYGVFIGCVFVGSDPNPAGNPQVVAEVVFDQDLVDELNEMARLDQVAAYIPQGKHKDLSPEEWDAFKLNTFETHQRRWNRFSICMGLSGMTRLERRVPIISG